MVRHIEKNTLNVGRKKTPDGYFVAVLDSEAYSKLKDHICRLGLTVEDCGNFIIVKSRSWSIIEKLMNIAKGLGVQVKERKE